MHYDITQPVDNVFNAIEDLVDQPKRGAEKQHWSEKWRSKNFSVPPPPSPSKLGISLQVSCPSMLLCAEIASFSTMVSLSFPLLNTTINQNVEVTTSLSDFRPLYYRYYSCLCGSRILSKL